MNETERGLQTARGDGLILRPMSLDWFASGTEHHFFMGYGEVGQFPNKNIPVQQRLLKKFVPEVHGKRIEQVLSTIQVIAEVRKI